MTINLYSNLAKVKNYLNFDNTEASANTVDDATLVNFINRASRAVDTYTRRKFYPRYETRYYDFIDSKFIRLDDDLLSLSALRTQNGASLVSSSALFLQTGDNYNRGPFDKIVLKIDTGSVLQYSGTVQKANEVEGWWGYHEDYPNAWVDTGTSLLTDYLASAGSINLAGAGSFGTGASDRFGEHPRISVGDLLKIKEQYFHVLAPGSAGNNIALVAPYANGTSGASAGSGASIAKFYYEPDIEWATRRLATWLYGGRDTPFQSKTAFVQLGTIEIPVALAVDVKAKLERFKRRTFTTFPK